MTDEPGSLEIGSHFSSGRIRMEKCNSTFQLGLIQNFSLHSSPDRNKSSLKCFSISGNPIMMASNGLLTLAMIAGGAISFFVVFETLWNGELELLFRNSTNIKLYEYAARTFINLLITLVPLLIPTCEIFVNLISSFSYPVDSIIIPILLQVILLWRSSKRNASFVLVLLLNAVILIASIGFSIVSFVLCVQALVEYYS